MSCEKGSGRPHRRVLKNERLCFDCIRWKTENPHEKKCYRSDLLQLETASISACNQPRNTNP